ncbi:helicase HerA-like domain-containing protein [Klebsiella pneumoniae]
MEESTMSSPLLIARTLDNALYLLPAMANRHGLITGATGTGKTVTLQKLAESFSEIGVPVFMADVKGDLTGIAAAGQSSERNCRRGWRRSASATGSRTPTRWCSGISLARRATRCGRRSPISAPCCWRACSISTRCRAAY